MSNDTEIFVRESYPVRIGPMVMYCEHFKASCNRIFAEQSSVSGDTFFSNTNKKALKVTFDGRIYDEDFPLRILNYSEGFMRSDNSFDVEYRGLKFKNCHLQSYTAEDKGEEYIYASITFVTVDLIERSEF